MYHEISLNIMEAITGISITSRRPREAVSYGAGFNNPESTDKGGAYFQQHRQGDSPTYVANALPTETGYVSVGRELCRILSISGGTGRLGYASGCTRDHIVPATYSEEITGQPVHLPTGTVIMEHNKLHQYGTGGLSTCRSEMPVKGIDLMSCGLIGISRIGGRLLAFTSTEIYVSSAEDSFDFTPSLRTQAQALSIVYPIGSIVTIVPVGEIAYVLGKTGGVVMKCTGDANFPYSFGVIDDFDGISHWRNCLVDYASIRTLCFSRSGLVWLEGDRAVKSWADISSDLMDTTRVKFPDDFPLAQDIEQGVRTYSQLDGYNTAGLDHTDNPLVSNSTLHVEQSDVARLVSVRNSSHRYVFVSYAPVGYSDISAIFQRCFVYDKWLNRSTVLHINHTDIICGKDDTLFYCDDKGETYQLIRDAGIAIMYWDRYTSTNRKAVKLVGIAAYGDFNTDMYDLGDIHSGLTIKQPPIPSSIPCISGQDISLRNARHSLRLLTKRRSELLYSGLVVGHQVSFAFGFSGRLTELVLRRSQ